MNKPIHQTDVECTSGYNLSHVKNGPRYMRVICAYQDPIRRKVYETILRSVGGVASHGLCESHYEEEIAKTATDVRDEINALADPEETNEEIAIRLINQLEETGYLIDDDCQKWRFDDFKTA